MRLIGGNDDIPITISNLVFFYKNIFSKNPFKMATRDIKRPLS